MAERRRVVITGIGAITPIGIGAEAMWTGLQAQRSPIRVVTRFDASIYRSRMAAEIDFDPTDYLEDRRIKRLDRFAQFVVTGARLAIEDSRINLAAEDRERIGSAMGTALGGVAFAEEQFQVFKNEGIKNVAVNLATSVFVGAASCNVAIEFGVQGPNTTNGMSCASGTMAIGDGFRLIRDNYADVMIAGGAETPLSQLSFGAFAILRAMSNRNDDPEHASRPFDAARDGFVMGEGAGILVLEEYERAKSRGAHIYAEICGYAFSNDAHHMTAPRPDGSQAARAIRGALRDAHVEPHEVGYVNAHGSGTPLNDPTETRAIHQAYGDHASKLQVSSTKSYYGHALGASGAMETAICAMSLERGWLPPTLNLCDPDDGCDLDYIPREGRNSSVEYAVNNSFGFGGINAALVLRRI